MTIVIGASVFVVLSTVCGVICAGIAIYNFFWGRKK
jgi:hypothetical protein